MKPTDPKSMLEAAREWPVTELPVLVGLLESMCVALSRIATPPAPAPADHDELLDIAEAARRLGISKSFLYRHHGRGGFPPARPIGRKLLFLSSEIAAFLKKLLPSSRNGYTYTIAAQRRKGGK
jgi:excisionase family DNA binding protein